MQIDKLILVNQSQMQLLVDSGRYKANVVYIVSSASFAVVLYDIEGKEYSHVLSFTQRAQEGRKPDPKLFKTFPSKELKKMDLLQDQRDLALFGNIGI